MLKHVQVRKTYTHGPSERHFLRGENFPFKVDRSHIFPTDRNSATISKEYGSELVQSMKEHTCKFHQRREQA